MSPLRASAISLPLILSLVSSANAAAAQVSALSCPSANGQTYTATDGAVYTIECFVDRPNSDIAGSPFPALSFQNCINQCESQSGCVDVAFYPPASGAQNGSCWQKSAVNNGYTNNNVWGARMTSPSTILTCPHSNGQTFTASDGAKYTVECFVDRPGNDLSNTQVPSLETCISACETTNGCIDVAFAPPASGSSYGTCWLKSYAGGSSSNQNRWGARKQNTLSCPASNGQTYKVPDGSTYAIECGLDRPNNDISNSIIPSIEGCIARCEATRNCNDIAWAPSNGQCWLKTAAGPSYSNSARVGARKLSNAAAPTTTTKVAACTPTPTISSQGKRGLTYNNASYTEPFSLSCSVNNSRVNWAYNWGSSPYYPNSAAQGGDFNSALRFIPMLWNNDSALTSIWQSNAQDAINNYRADAVLGFNEPDLCQGGSACMTVASAVSAWKQYIQPFHGQVTLVSPAVSNSQAAGQGLSWLSQFISSCSGCNIDAIALHWYGDITSPGSFMSYMQSAYQQFNKPLYITEFAGTSGTTDQVTAFLKAVLPWIEQQSYIARAAYFMDAPSTNGNIWLINSNGTVSTVGTLYDQYN